MSGRFVLAALFLALASAVPSCAQDTSESPKHFDVFRATIGVDDGVIHRGTSAIFKVYLDDEEVFDSGVVRPGEDPRDIEIPLGDAKKLLLEVGDTGDGHGGDWGNWCDARLANSQTGDHIFLSDIKEKVVSEWINTRKDRNIINEPIELQERVYCKGLGTISGSKMEYSDWNELASELEAQHAEYDSAPVGIKGEIPEGVVVRIGKTEYSAQASPIDVGISPGEELSVSLVVQEGESLLSHQALTSLLVDWGQGPAELGLMIPSRIIHTASDDGKAPILLGRPYWGASGTGERAEIVYERWRLAAERDAAPLGRSLPRGVYLLHSVYGIQKSEEARYATVVFRVRSGDSGALLNTLITGPNFGEIGIHIDPHLPLTLEVDDMGDGNYGDDALWADVALLGVTDMLERTGERYPLSDFDPWSAKVGWERLGVNTNSTGGQMQIGDDEFFSGFGASAKSEIVFKDLLPAIEAMRSAAQKVAEARAAMDDPETARSFLQAAKALDDKNPNIYLSLAELSVKDIDVHGELSALKRLIEISRASVPQRRQAKERIEEIYSDIGLAKPLDLGAKRPPEATDPGMIPLEATDPLDISDLGGTIRRVTIGGEVPDDSPLLLLPGVVRFRVSRDKGPLTAVVNSRGTELSLEIREGWHEGLEGVERAPIVASTEAKVCPRISVELEPGEYTLLIWHDGNKDKIECDFDVDVAFDTYYRLDPSPFEQWRYTIHLDGSVSAQATIVRPDVVQIPLTAEGFWVEGAEYTLTYPVFEYCSKIGNRESMMLLVFPTNPTEAGWAIVSYAWPDGAYNVPMSRYADDRRERFYFRTLPSLNYELRSLRINVSLPEHTGKIERLVPETFKLTASAVERFEEQSAVERIEEQIKAEEGKKDYELKHPAVMPDSESVSVDGQAVKRGDDYTLESWSGTLKFNEAPPKDAAIAVSYKYALEDVTRTYMFEMDWDKPVTIHAVNEALQSSWLVETYKQMRVFIPETDYYRAWLPEYMALLQRIYDAESKAVGGYEPDDEIFVSLTGPAQLSGYGGATWGGPLSESWIASTGRVGEYNLRYEPGGDGVEAHELKWVFLHGIGGARSAPHWLRTGAVIWIEEQGKLAGDTAFPDVWCYGTLRKNARKYLDEYTSRPECILQLPEDDYRKQHHSDRDVGDAMCWYIHDFLAQEYGEDFWGTFYKFQRDHPARYKILDPRSKAIQVVDDIVEISGDESARRQFTDWGFDLSPDPQYAPDVCVLFGAYWRFSTGDDASWADPALDDSDWDKIAIGGVWEDNDEYEGHDGFAWYRLRFVIPEGFEPSETLELSLGEIDDVDEVFLNGEKVGQTGKFPPEYEGKHQEQRRYDVPRDLIKVGEENILAVRVYDGGGGGGITGEGFWLRKK